MRWFRATIADVDDATDRRALPLLATDLMGRRRSSSPPNAMLRDEGPPCAPG